MFRRAKPPRRRRSLKVVCDSIEVLEDRTLLSATPAAVIDAGTLQTDQSAYSSTDIIVKWNSAANLAGGQNANALANSIMAGAKSAAISPTLTNLHRVTLAAGTDVAQALQRFQHSNLVEYAEYDYQIQVAAVPNDPNYSQMWDLENTGQTGGSVDADIDASAAWDVNTGSGNMVVAVIDTGVDYLHPDLSGNMWVNTGEIAGNGIDDDGNGYVDDYYGYDFINHDGDPMDDQGHGTHVAGTIGAEGNNGIGVTGINWDVQLMALKFLGADGSGSTSDAIEAILYAVNNGAQVINASWGGDPFSQTLYDALSVARDNGVIFVAAAGNGNSLGIGVNNDQTAFYPSGYNLDNIISVAATDNNDNLATFSNYGATTVDLAAPGVDILSTTMDGSYGYMTGTSMATPHVTGAVALLRDYHPDWTYSQIVDQILGTVDQLPQLAGLMTTGGRLNLAAALGNPVPPPPPPPPVSLPVLDDFSDGQAQEFDAQSGVWGVSSGRFDVSPSVDDNNMANIATLRLADAVPSDVQMQFTLNADEGHVEIFGIVLQDLLTNGFAVFDYVDNNNFKFAGADMKNDQWVIGHRDDTGWYTDASFGQVLDAATDYQVKVTIQNGSQVTLSSGGVDKVAYTYAGSVTGGDLGFGSRNAMAHFDNVLVQEIVPVTPGTLPLTEDFQDGVADHIQPVLGVGGVIDGRYQISAFSGSDAISLIDLSDPLPANLEFSALIDANDATSTQLSNAFIIFDYQSPTDFKWAGAYVGVDQWAIGHRDSTGWITDAYVDSPMDALTQYDLKVTIQDGGHVTLYSGGAARVSFVYNESLTDGAIGMGTKNAVARYDNLLVQEYTGAPNAGTLPLQENFDDGVADNFVLQTGGATVANGNYQIMAAPGLDGLSTVAVAGGLPSNVQFSATINANDSTTAFLSNAFLIFDYHSPTDFKWAGAYVGVNQWAIGHRDASGWVTDNWVGAPINPNTDYTLELLLDSSGGATLLANGVEQLSYNYGTSLTGGDIGVGTKNAIARFDNVNLQELTNPPAATLPYMEDFNDGSAGAIVVTSGIGGIVGGQYQISPVGGNDAISLLQLANPVPANVEFSALIDANAATSNQLSNAFLIFDYQSPTDFKFAGAYVGVDQWAIGHRNASGWFTDAYVDSPMDALTQYDLKVVLQDGGHVTLYSGGAARVSFIYNESLTDGAIGLGTKNATARYDNLLVQAYTGTPNAGSLPLQENFDDGVADNFVLQTGGATLSNGNYQIMAAPGLDGLSTVAVAGGLPSNVQFSATINANSGTSAFLSNAFLIFDYHSPTDFKWAGAYVGVNQWAIGHRDATGWVTDRWVGATINSNTDYALQLSLDSSGVATLSANGVQRASFNYGTSLTDGAVGVGTKTAVARFDNIVISDPTAVTTQSLASDTVTSDPPITQPAWTFGIQTAAPYFSLAVENGNTDDSHRQTDFPPLQQLLTDEELG